MMTSPCHLRVTDKQTGFLSEKPEDISLAEACSHSHNMPALPPHLLHPNPQSLETRVTEKKVSLNLVKRESEKGWARWRMCMALRGNIGFVKQ